MFKFSSVMLLLFCILFFPLQSMAEVIRVAVASNFKAAMIPIAERFKASTKHNVALSFGSTGKYYAQIINGAPFDLFFAADVERPMQLEKDGLVLPNSRFTYAIGKLVLWSAKPELVDSQGHVLQNSHFRHLALANPRFAPYGQAAQQVLQARGVWEQLMSRLVYGENIAQTFQFVNSANAELGFVALSQIKNAKHAAQGSFWYIPQALYKPIQQQVVLLKENAAARSLLSFMRSEQALQIMHDYGYDTE